MVPKGTKYWTKQFIHFIPILTPISTLQMGEQSESEPRSPIFTSRDGTGNRKAASQIPFEPHLGLCVQTHCLHKATYSNTRKSHYLSEALNLSLDRMLHFSMAERAGPFRTRCGLEIEVKSLPSGGLQSVEQTRSTGKVTTY